HILNLAAQTIIWGRDKNRFENEKLNLQDEEDFIAEWRSTGPIGVLFDVLNSITSSPQQRELFIKFQQESAEQL
ncbi:hypothetical protein EJ04DRAFT_413022, partial [Polyplosphaeria fusca]